ncbi:diaminopimelate epimerase [Oscillospiraceae bacterium CM]|nr:diaminopimelate epimerase [Oscillospiraceae bacterium CM]
MKFTKMHGIGNDYVHINCLTETVDDPAALSRRLSDRHFGIGGDGIILICPSETADFKMRIFNADGSEAQMCGNGIRSFGKYVFDRSLTEKTTLSVETLAGLKSLTLNVENGTVATVRVDMGEPILKAADIPVLSNTEDFINKPVTSGGETYTMTCVSMGNPHGVIFVDSVDALDLAHIGPPLENHTIFPERANIEFVECLNDETLKMRVWERGSGETLACGTGACAALVAAVLNGKARRHTTLLLRGGALDINWDESTNHVFMTGPAEFVFDGEI